MKVSNPDNHPDGVGVNPTIAGIADIFNAGVVLAVVLPLATIASTLLLDGIVVPLILAHLGALTCAFMANGLTTGEGRSAVLYATFHAGMLVVLVAFGATNAPRWQFLFFMGFVAAALLPYLFVVARKERVKSKIKGLVRQAEFFKEQLDSLSRGQFLLDKTLAGTPIRGRAYPPQPTVQLFPHSRGKTYVARAAAVAISILLTALAVLNPGGFTLAIALGCVAFLSIIIGEAS